MTLIKVLIGGDGEASSQKFPETRKGHIAALKFILECSERFPGKVISISSDRRVDSDRPQLTIKELEQRVYGSSVAGTMFR